MAQLLLLPSFVCFPDVQDLCCILHPVAAEHMGVAADHLMGDAIDNLLESKRFSQIRLEDNLQEQIAKLFSKSRLVTRFDRIVGLIRFL